MTTSLSNDILSAALSGLEMQRQRVDEQIAEVRRMLGSSAHTITPIAAGVAAPNKRSAAVRARMAAAQRKRWAAVRAAKKVS